MTTHFIDTNYFLRFLLRDDETQFKVAYQLLQDTIEDKIQSYTAMIVIFEIHWVLSSFYKQNKSEVIEKLEKIVSLPNLKIENEEIIAKALKIFKYTSLDLEDCYNIAYAQTNSIDEFSSFDQKAVKIFKKK
jgi:predicted nucleic-acid-binding protein